MRAMRIDGKRRAIDTHDENVLLTHVPYQLAVDEVGDGDTKRQVWPRRRLVLARHVMLRRCVACSTLQAASARNSWRTLGSSRKFPSMCVVTSSVPGLCTPRVVMHSCVARM